MRKAPGFLILFLFMAGCASSGKSGIHQRLDAAEQNQQTLELRVGLVEERLSRVENEIGVPRPVDAPMGATVQPLAVRIPAALTLDAPRQEGRPVPAPTMAPPIDIPAQQASPRQWTEAAPPQITGHVDSLTLRPISPPSQPAAPELAPLAAPLPELSPTLDLALLQPLHPAPELLPAPAPQQTPQFQQAAPAQPPRQHASRIQPGEKAAYDAALDLYFGRQFSQAREAFQEFLRSSPGSALAPNALYWQAESLYALGQYTQAIPLFQEVVTRFPKHDKAAAALLKAGYSYERIGDMDNARFYWQILLDDFPRSAPAALARQRLGRG